MHTDLSLFINRKYYVLSDLLKSDYFFFYHFIQIYLKLQVCKLLFQVICETVPGLCDSLIWKEKSGMAIGKLWCVSILRNVRMVIWKCVIWSGGNGGLAVTFWVESDRMINWL